MLSASSASGSRHTSWSPTRFSASLPLPMPTWTYSTLCLASHILSSQDSSCVVSAASARSVPRTSRCTYSSSDRAYAAEWVNFRKSPASNQPPSTSTVGPIFFGTAASSSVSGSVNCGVSYTPAVRSARCDGLRCSRPGTTSAPSRWTVKKSTASAASGPNRSQPKPTLNVGDTAPAASIVYVPGTPSAVKSMGCTDW